MVRLVLTCFPVVYQSEGVDAKKAHGVAASTEVVSAMTKTNSEEDLAVPFLKFWLSSGKCSV